MLAIVLTNYSTPMERRVNNRRGKTMKKRILDVIALAIFVAITSFSAKANTITYTITGAGLPDSGASFTLPTTSATNPSEASGNATVDAGGAVFSDSSVSIFSDSEDGDDDVVIGFSSSPMNNFLDDTLLVLSPDASEPFVPLVGGSFQDPTLLPFPTFTMMGELETQSFQFLLGGTYDISATETLTSTPTTVTPEPSSLLLMATGFLTMLGVGLINLNAMA
jgi:hypothetical protein